MIDLKKLRARLGNCKRCGGWFEMGTDEFDRPTAKCIACGRSGLRYATDKTPLDEAAMTEASLRRVRSFHDTE